MRTASPRTPALDEDFDMIRRTLASLMVMGSLVACAPVGYGGGGYYAGSPSYYGPSRSVYAGGYAPSYGFGGYRPSYGYAPSYGGGFRPNYAPAYGGGYRPGFGGPPGGGFRPQAAPNLGGGFNLRPAPPSQEGRVGRMAREMAERGR
jgi:hypothetical protein